jgi:hypothetical protein
MTATLRTDFDAFLLAPMGEDANGLPLNLLTIFARLGVDPWEEAADLAALPVEPAMQRLANRLEASPNAPASPADTVNIVTRLIALLHRAPPRKAVAPRPLVPLKVFELSKGARLAVTCLIGALFLLLAQCAFS